MSAIHLPGGTGYRDPGWYGRGAQLREAVRSRICHECGEPLDPATVDAGAGTARCANGHVTRLSDGGYDAGQRARGAGT